MLFISEVWNSWGHGIYIYAVINGNRYPEIGYYAYGKREAIKRYRNEHGLKGKHLTMLSI